MGHKRRKKIWLSVNCYPNDPVDIRCGGPGWLGFDFNIFEDDLEFTLGAIAAHHPISSKWTGEGRPSRAWKRKDILAEVKKQL